MNFPIRQIVFALLLGAGTVFASEAHLFNVRNYGAKGDGKSDDTAAVQKTIAAAWKSMRSTSDTRTVYFPAGRYIVNGEIRLRDLSLRGEDANIVQKDPKATTFYYTTFWSVRITGITFHGGSGHVSISNDNIDKSLFFVDHCRFFHAAQTALETRKGAQSTLFTVSNCEFIRCGKAVDSGSDWTVLRDFWLMTPEKMFNSAAIVNRQGYMTVDNMLGVPLCNGNHQRWIDNYGNLLVTGCRFGAEGGGFTAVYNFARYRDKIPRTVIIRASQISAQTSLARNCAVYCVEFPNLLAIENNSLSEARPFIASPELQEKLGHYFYAPPGYVKLQISGNVGADSSGTDFRLPEFKIHPPKVPEGWLNEEAAGKAAAKFSKVPEKNGSCEVNCLTQKDTELVLEGRLDGSFFNNAQFLKIVRRNSPAILMRCCPGKNNDAPFATLKHVKVDLDVTPYFIMDMASSDYGEFAVKLIDEQTGRLYAFRAQQRGLGRVEVNLPKLVPQLAGKKQLSLRIYYIGRTYRKAKGNVPHHYLYAPAGSGLEIRELGFNSKKKEKK